MDWLLDCWKGFVAAFKSAMMVPLTMLAVTLAAAGLVGIGRILLGPHEERGLLDANVFLAPQQGLKKKEQWFSLGHAAADNQVFFSPQIDPNRIRITHSGKKWLIQDSGGPGEVWIQNPGDKRRTRVPSDKPVSIKTGVLVFMGGDHFAIQFTPQGGILLNNPGLTQCDRFREHGIIGSNEPIQAGFRLPMYPDERLTSTSRKPEIDPSKEIITVLHPDNDPELAKMIRAVERRIESNPQWNELDKIMCLLDAVDQILPETDPDTVNAVVRNLMNGNREVLLGQVIHERIGRDSHRALLFKVFADHVGIKAALEDGMYGGGTTQTRRWNVVVLSEDVPLVGSSGTLDATIKKGTPLLVDALEGVIHTFDHSNVRVYKWYQGGSLYNPGQPVLVSAGAGIAAAVAPLSVRAF